MVVGAAPLTWAMTLVAVVALTGARRAGDTPAIDNPVEAETMADEPSPLCQVYHVHPLKLSPARGAARALGNDPSIHGPPRTVDLMPGVTHYRECHLPDGSLDLIDRFVYVPALQPVGGR